MCVQGLTVPADTREMADQPLNQRLREIREAHVDPVDEPAPEPRRRAPLGRLLLEKGLLSGDILDQALEHQRENGRPLGQILVELDAISPQHLARALTEQHGFDFGGSLRARLTTGGDAEASDEGTDELALFVKDVRNPDKEANAVTLNKGAAKDEKAKDDKAKDDKKD